MELADRMGRLGTESAFEVLARAKRMEAKGREVIHLEIGEPDFPTPDHIVEAAERALRDGHTRYCPAPGLPELREAVAGHFVRTRHLEYPPERIVITPGAKPILFFVIAAVCGPGDEAIYPDPGFPMYESLISYAGATPVPLPLREERGFRADPTELASLVSERTRLVVLNSPHNPCGSSLDRRDLEAVAASLEGRDVVVLSDEVYWAIRYGEEHASIAQVEGMADRTVLLDGCSKTYAMTGWRLGFAALPDRLVEPVTRLIVNSVSCTPPFVQLAGVTALEGPQDPVEEMVAAFGRRREAIVEGLNALPGLSCQEPSGAFYAFPSVARLGRTSAEVADLLLERAGVACLDGAGFGAHGDGFLRFSYANSVGNIEKALRAMEAVLADL